MLCAFGWAGPARAAENDKPADAAGAAVDAAATLQLEVFLNGVAVGLITPFTQGPDGALSTTPDELRQLGFAPDRLPNGRIVRLTAIPGLTYRYDASNQVIHLKAPWEALTPHRLSAQGRPARVQTSPVADGAVLNYAVFAAAGWDEERKAGRFDGVSAALDARAFGRYGVVRSTAVVRAGAREGRGVVRLDSAWTYVDQDRAVAARAGDLTSGGLSWSRPVRLGGVQVSRRFDVRPDLVTAAIPVITGTAQSASALDLYVDGVKALSQPVPAGPFVIDQAPIVYGGGVAQVVVRDATGRETVTRVPFYASPQVLAPGVTDFSAEAGFARRGYGRTSNDYDGQLALSASVRRGLWRQLTAEGRFETTAGMTNAGAGAAVTLGRWGVASAALAGSVSDERSGALADFALETRHAGFAANLRMQRASAGYEDLASWTAEPLRLDRRGRADFRPPRALDQVTVSVPVGEYGQTSLSYTHVRRTDDRIRVMGLSYSQDLGPVRLFASGVADVGGRGGSSAFVGLSVPFGANATASVGATRNERGLAAVAEASSPAPIEGGTGWRLRGTAGELADVQGTVERLHQRGRAEGTLERVSGAWRASAFAEGAVALVGRDPFLARRLDGAFAVVDAGAPGVPVRRENRLVGSTDRRGLLLAPDLVAHQANRLAVDPTYLPLHLSLPVTTARVAPAEMAGVRVRLAPELAGPAAIVQFLLPSGDAVQPGALARITDGEAEEVIVGYDGEAYMTGLAERNEVEVTLPDGGACRAYFAFKPEPGRQGRVPGVVCRSLQVAGGAP